MAAVYLLRSALVRIPSIIFRSIVKWIGSSRYLWNRRASAVAGVRDLHRTSSLVVPAPAL
jgi:hypothetical protein